MIPIRVEYDDRIRRDLFRIGEPVRLLLERINQSSWTGQKDITLSKQYEEYFKYLDDLRSYVIEAFSGFCAYCTREASHIKPLHPLEKNRDFPQLSQEIENIYALCESCYKRIVITYRRLRLPQRDDIDRSDLMKKVPSLIIPNEEHAHRYVSWDRRGQLRIEPRLQETLLTLGLESYIRDIPGLRQGDPDATYNAMWDHKFRFSNRDYANDFSFASSIERFNPLTLDEYISPVPITIIRDEIQKKMHQWRYFNELRLENIRCFDTATIHLQHRKSLCILGDNGVGKTTILRALSLLGPGVLRRRSKVDDLKLHPRGALRVQLSQPNAEAVAAVMHHLNIFPSPREQIPMCYISEQRLRKGFMEKFVRALLDDDKFFNDAAQIINFILDLKVDEGLERNDDGIFLHRSGFGPVNIFESSSGALSIFFIIYTIHQTFHGSYERGSNPPDSYFGIVLIDEIELHLHPKWKIGIAAKLIKIYPDLFFVMTTHDPLVLQGLDVSNVIVLEKSFGESQTRIRSDFPDVEGYSIDLLLTSPLFRLPGFSKTEGEDAMPVATSHREHLINKIYQRSLDMNLNYSAEDLSALVAKIFGEDLRSLEN